MSLYHDIEREMRDTDVQLHLKHTGLTAHVVPLLDTEAVVVVWAVLIRVDGVTPPQTPTAWPTRGIAEQVAADTLRGAAKQG